MSPTLSRYVTSGVVVLVGSSVIAATPTTGPLPNVQALTTQLTAGQGEGLQFDPVQGLPAVSDYIMLNPHGPPDAVVGFDPTALDMPDNPTDMVIEVIRHGQRQPPWDMRTNPSPPWPGPELSQLGHQQAQEAAEQLQQMLGDDVAGIYSGEGIRDLETALPFAQIADMDVVALRGLAEIGGGIYGLADRFSLGLVAQVFTMLAWAAGSLLWPMKPGSLYANGVIFNDLWTGAMDYMYNESVLQPDDPVISDNGEITAVAFNNEFSTLIWSLLNVKNPWEAFSAMVNTLEHTLSENPNSPGYQPAFLEDGGIVEFEGNPAEGWMVTSWSGIDVDTNPGVWEQLYVDYRDVSVALQEATWHIFHTFIDNPTEIGDTVDDAFQDISAALNEFPETLASIFG